MAQSQKVFHFVSKCSNLQKESCQIKPLNTISLGGYWISAQGHDFAPFLGDLNQGKKPSEIKPPLVKPEMRSDFILILASTCVSYYFRDL